MVGTWRGGQTAFSPTLFLTLGLAVLAACGTRTPSPSLSGYPLVSAEALTLSESLKELEREFYVAVQRHDDATAHARANAAVPLIEAFLDGPLQTQTGRCLEEAQAAAGELLSLQLSQWRTWAAGRDYPDRDEISLYFAFSGGDKGWKVVLDEAGDRCQQTA